LGVSVVLVLELVACKKKVELIVVFNNVALV
jgi:hypothetical protein